MKEAGIYSEFSGPEPGLCIPALDMLYWNKWAAIGSVASGGKRSEQNKC